VFRSFFPSPLPYFVSALAWAAVCMIAWFTIGPILQSFLNIAPLLGIQPTPEGATPDFFNPDRVWLYQYILMAGYAFCVPWYFLNDNRRWYWWAVVGSVTIVEIIYFQVQISAWLNEWYGDFYDLIQQALQEPGSVTADEYFGKILTVAFVLVPNICVLVFSSFFIQHYLFRWRRAMTFYYMTAWPIMRGVEGAAQRIQEDTQRFASITEGLASSFVGSIMTLLVFLPLLWNLSAEITELPIIGHVDGSLVWVALVSAAFGTVLLAVVGIRLPGLEFQNQRVEAAYRKELVYGEDHFDRSQPPSIREFFLNVQRNYFRLYFNYLYFNVFRYAYLQGAIFVPYIAMGPSIVTAAITFGTFQQVLNAFGQVEDSFRYLVNSWTTIISLISVYLRLRTFERSIPRGANLGVDYDDPRFMNSGEVILRAPPATEPPPAPAQ
jgi:peptide/bleomycin uptake transporter